MNKMPKIVYHRPNNKGNFTFEFVTWGAETIGGVGEAGSQGGGPGRRRLLGIYYFRRILSYRS